jgi:hypothetical protein
MQLLIGIVLAIFVVIIIQMAVIDLLIYLEERKK